MFATRGGASAVGFLARVGWKGGGIVKRVGALASVVAAGSAHGQIVAEYVLDKESTWFEEHCLPPCMCPYAGFTEAVTGSFHLANEVLTQNGFVYDVEGVVFQVQTPGGPATWKGSGTYFVSKNKQMHSMSLEVADGTGRVAPLESPLVAVVPPGPLDEISIKLQSGQIICTAWTVTVKAAGKKCYADCDGSGGLDVFDFLCFTNRFNAGEPGADCDGSGQLDVFDFLCFVNAFNGGCS